MIPLAIGKASQSRLERDKVRVRADASLNSLAADPVSLLGPRVPMPIAKKTYPSAHATRAGLPLSAYTRNIISL